MEGYGERIKQLRALLGLSQQELAKKLGVHKQMVSDVERHKQKRFSLESEAKLYALGVDPIWLCTGVGEPLGYRAEEITEEMALIRKYFLMIPPQRRIEKVIEILRLLQQK